MKLKGLNICSFDPYDDFGLPKGTRYRQMNNPFISFILQPSYQDDFTTNKMTYVGTTYSYNGTNKNQDFTLLNTTSADQSYVDMLGSTISDSKWILRTKFVLSTLTTNSTSNLKMDCLGVFASSSDMTTAQDGLFLVYENDSINGNKFYVMYTDGQAPNTTFASQTQAFTTTPTTTTYYVEIIRLSTTSVKITLYSDSTYTTVVEAQTLTIPSTVISLRYLQHSGRSGTTNGSIVGTIDDVKFWNGISSF